MFYLQPSPLFLSGQTLWLARRVQTPLLTQKYLELLKTGYIWIAVLQEFAISSSN